MTRLFSPEDIAWVATVNGHFSGAYTLRLEELRWPYPSGDVLSLVLRRKDGLEVRVTKKTGKPGVVTFSAGYPRALVGGHVVLDTTPSGYDRGGFAVCKALSASVRVGRPTKAVAREVFARVLAPLADAYPGLVKRCRETEEAFRRRDKFVAELGLSVSVGLHGDEAKEHRHVGAYSALEAFVGTDGTARVRASVTWAQLLKIKELIGTPTKKRRKA